MRASLIVGPHNAPRNCVNAERSPHIPVRYLLGYSDRQYLNNTRRVYNMVIFYGADGMQCRTTQSLDHCYRGAGAKGLIDLHIKIQSNHLFWIFLPPFLPHKFWRKKWQWHGLYVTFLCWQFSKKIKISRLFACTEGKYTYINADISKCIRIIENRDQHPISSLASK